MSKKHTGLFPLLLSVPWCCVLPAVLSSISVGGAAAARLAIGPLLPFLFAFSILLLGYAHFRAWIRREGHRTARLVLMANTVLVALLWYERAKIWLLR